MSYVVWSCRVALGHRVAIGESGCDSVHGHTFEVSATVSTPSQIFKAERLGRLATARGVFNTYFASLDGAFVAHDLDTGMVKALVSLASKRLIVDEPPTIDTLAEVFFRQAAPAVARFGLVLLDLSVSADGLGRSVYTSGDAALANAENEDENEP